MKMQETGLVIRTAFNNQGWAGRCEHPLNDQRCFKCLEGGLYINRGDPITEEDGNGYCKGEPEEYPLSYLADVDEEYWCWEQILCKKYCWGNVKGKWRKVFREMPVYFVYPEINKTLTLWGHSVIDKTDNTHKVYPPIFFKPFKPMPENKWIKGLTGEEITGKKWGQLNFRYLDKSHEQYLSSLVEGKERLQYRSSDSNVLESYEGLSVELKRDIKEKLVKIANNEGREIKDVIREAVAKLIRERGF